MVNFRQVERKWEEGGHRQKIREILNEKDFSKPALQQLIKHIEDEKKIVARKIRQIGNMVNKHTRNTIYKYYGPIKEDDEISDMVKAAMVSVTDAIEEEHRSYDNLIQEIKSYAKKMKRQRAPTIYDDGFEDNEIIEDSELEDALVFNEPFDS